jgi:uncharacterized caspase-like protein
MTPLGLTFSIVGNRFSPIMFLAFGLIYTMHACDAALRDGWVLKFGIFHMKPLSCRPRAIVASVAVFFVALARFDTTLSAAETRHALVVGNNAYQHARPLTNPRNDAQAVSAKLKTLGFTVVERTDTTLKDMKLALREFVQSVPADGVALVYYAGHGVQLKGTNYLVPVDAQMAEEFEVPDEALSMDAILRGLEGTRSGLNIIVLDCCRDDPFSRSWRGSRSIADKGLVMPADMPQGMFIAYATSPGRTADDGEAGNSPYTAALLEELDQPGVDFEKVFKNVGAKVVKSTGGKQEPWFNSKFYGTFCFALASPSATNPALGPATVTANEIPTATASMGAAPDLPPGGFFSLNQVFGNTDYESFNSHSRSNILKLAQTKLKDDGFYKLTPDGNMGKGTQSAILDFQRAEGLPPTGLLDQDTLTKLTLNGIPEQQPPAAAAPRTSGKGNSPPPQTPDPAPASNGGAPYGIRIPGKQGFVYSPHDRTKPVDVRGIAPGTKVRCPYTGEIFYVP